MQYSLTDLNNIFSEPHGLMQQPIEPQIPVASCSVETQARDNLSSLLESDDFLKDGFYSEHFLSEHCLDDNLLTGDLLGDMGSIQEILGTSGTDNMTMDDNPTQSNLGE